MRRSKVKAKLSRGEPVLVPALHFTDPSIYELTSLMGFDCIWMDLEHHGYSVETAGQLMRAARVGGADVMARPAKGEFMRMGRLLEAGAQGIMYPRCDDAAEAAEVVRWSKFAPLGRRGFDGGNSDMPFCSLPIDHYVREANAETFVVIQIEELRAVDEARAIAAVEGVDVLFIGPADLSITSGVPGQFDHPLIHESIRKVAEAARLAGKVWGTTSGSLERTRQLLELGARFICHGCDLVFVKAGLEAIRREFSPLGFTFDDRLGQNRDNA
jgi:4-hydroxy-2-oxoheptanedioate aldolase